MEIIFGVDIGGTAIKFGAFSKEGDLYEKWSVPTDLSDGGKHIIPTVAGAVTEYLSERKSGNLQIAGIGMGIPGPVDQNGYVKSCVNLNWYDFNPVTELQSFFPKMIIAAENDANTAAFGEYKKGAGSTCSSMMFVTLGTGVGGGIVLDGKLWTGAHGLAGEIGHIRAFEGTAEACNCGNIGCVDQIASATGIVRYMRHLLQESKEESPLRGETNLTARRICEQAKKGDALALKCVRTCMGVLGKALAWFSHAFDPEVFVIGGGVSYAGEIIVEAVRDGYRKNLFLIKEGADIRLAGLKNDAGITGAALLAMEGGRRG